MQGKGLSEGACLEIIKSTGAIRSGHFVLTSGRHTETYINKDAINIRPHLLSLLAKEIAEAFLGEADAQVVAVPAVGAIALGNWVAYHYREDVIAVFAETTVDGFDLRRGFDRFITKGTRVLLVDDIITTGKTTRAMIETVMSLGGEVVGLGLLWNRSTEDFRIPVFACVNEVLPTEDAQKCVLCQDSVSIGTDVGHGAEFMEEYGIDPRGWPANRK